MIKLPARIDLAGLAEEIVALEYWLDGSGAEMSITQSGGIPQFVGPLVRAAILDIVKYRELPPKHIMINKLKPGVEVPVHTDTVAAGNYKTAHVSRWHLPIVTNEQCYWWDEELAREIHLEYGYWHGPIKHWMKHSVKNLGTTERVHLVVDLLPNEMVL